MNLRPYMKAVQPALLTLLAVAIQWVVTGEYDRAELATTLTGFAAATVTYWTSNEPVDLDVEPGEPAAEPR